VSNLSKPSYEGLERSLDQFRADRRTLRAALEEAKTALGGVLDGDFVPSGRTVQSAFDHAAQTLLTIK